MRKTMGVICRRRFLAGAASACTVFSLPAAKAQNAVSFKDAKVTILIGSSPGGGTDAVGRLVGKFIGKYLPGEPQTIIQNMPGASGITAINHLVKRTEPNGLTVMMGSNSTMDPLVYRNANAQYDLKTIPMIGGIARG